MFDKAIPPLEEMKARAEAKEAAMDMLMDLLISAPMPEEKKAELLLLREIKKTTNCITDAMGAYIGPSESLEDAQKSYPVRKEAIEYLSLVRAGVQSFIDTHPLPQ